jgi:hypothetical protein
MNSPHFFADPELHRTVALLLFQFDGFAEAEAHYAQVLHITLDHFVTTITS